MSDPFVRAQGRGCAAQLAITVVAVGVVGVFLVLAVGAGSLAPGDQGTRVLAFGGTFLLLVMAFVVAALTFAARRARVLDPAFAQLGLQGSAFLVNVREYHGAVGGRPVDALYVRRGPMLETSVDARVQGTLAVGTRTGAGEVVRAALGMPTIALHDPAFANLVVSAADGAWAAAVLSVPAVRDLVLRAVHDPAGRELRVLALRPGAVRFTRRYFVPEQVVGEVAPMVAMLSSLAAAVEALPPPSVPVPLSSLEFAARKRPGAMGARFAAALIAGVVLVVLGGTIAVMMLTPSLSHPVGGAADEPGASAPLGGRRRHR